MGWKLVGRLTDSKQFVMIVAPHTSNWDLIVGLGGRFAVGVKIHFLAKRQLFFFPLGVVLRALGGIAVDRSKKNNQVDQVTALFKQQDDLKLAIAPEGTRSSVTRWKEGFYHIACQANIPIVMVGFDYLRKEIRIQEPFWPTHNINDDFTKIVGFFRTVPGRYPKEIIDYKPKL